jgi:hypothetical protein
MPAHVGFMWERAESFVDRQISPQKLHVWPIASRYPIDVRYLIMDRRQQIPPHRPDHLEKCHRIA